MELVRQKNVATIITFPIIDADGDTVTGASSLDSELDTWTDGAAPDGFADCTNEATEIGSTGIYYLQLTQTEMNNDYIYIQVKTATAGAKTQHILINTMVGDPLNRATTDDGGTINVAAGVVEAQVKSIDNNAITAASIASDAITAAKIAAGAIDAATFAADVDAEILSYIVDDATRIDASSLNTASVTSIPAILADTGTDGVVLAANSVSATAIAANAITAAKVASDVTDEIWAKACTEPAAVVAAAPTAIAALSWLLTLSRNKIEQTATTQTVYADDGTTPIAASTVSDDATTATRNEFV